MRAIMTINIIRYEMFLKEVKPNYIHEDFLGNFLRRTQNFLISTDTGEDSKLFHRRKRPKVDTLFSTLFSDATERRV